MFGSELMCGGGYVYIGKGLVIITANIKDLNHDFYGLYTLRKAINEV